MRARWLLLSLLLFVLLIVPASATYEITAEPLGGALHSAGSKITSFTTDVSAEGNAIQRISIDVPSGATVDFTLWYANGSTVTGHMTYEPSTNCVGGGLLNTCQHSEVSIGGDTQGYSYVGTAVIGRIDIVGYARNWSADKTTYTTGFIVYDSVFGVSERRAMAYYPVASISDNVIYKFQISSNKPVSVAWYTNTRQNVGQAASTNILEALGKFAAFLAQMAGRIYDFLVSLIGWIKFFFIDHLFLTLALYIAISMCFAARGARGKIPKFFRTFIGDQVKLVKFIIELFRVFVEIIRNAIG